MSTQPENANRVRTSDAERERVAETLRNAVTEGRLNLGEGDERLAALYATKYRDELHVLIADLPNDGGWAGGPDGSTRGHRPERGPAWGPATGWGGPARGPATGWGAGLDPAMWRRRRIFRAARLAVIAAVLISFFAVTGHFFWPIIPLFFLFNVVRLGVWHRHGMRMQHHGHVDPGWHP
jgi:uncharacterized protein DUF1707